MLKNILFSVHRLLGTILSILFLVWFLSGFVMIYHKFPRVSTKEKYSHMDAVTGIRPSADSLLKDSIQNKTVVKLTLTSFGGNTVFDAVTDSGPLKIAAGGNGEESSTLTFDQIKQHASRWSAAEISKVDTLYSLEQWIPFSYLKRHFPIYKFYFDDKEKHQLYVSSLSGEALQFTSKSSRTWAWLGAIPHWVYFTWLRQDTQQWMNVIIWLSGIGSVMCLSGIILGLWITIQQRRKNRRKTISPYKKTVYKWHHILGLFFGLFVFTFTFSGMMSLADLPQWIVKIHNPGIQQQLYTPRPINIENYKLDYNEILRQYPGKVKSLEWTSFGQLPLYKVVVDNRLLTINASGNKVTTLQLSETDIVNRLSELHNEKMNVSLLTGYDNYYVGRTDHLPLPVYKIEVDDADNSTYYINPENGNIRYFNTNSKVHKWTYQGLHSYKFKFLATRPVLWNIVMWLTMIGGTIVSATGVWLGYKYICRKIKQLKSHRR